MDKMHEKHASDGMHFRLVGGSRGNEKRVQFNGDGQREYEQNTKNDQQTHTRG